MNIMMALPMLFYFSTCNAVIVLLDTDKGIQGIGESACFEGPPTSTNLKYDNLKYC
jgi:L-alanine-DL-glutamate epimerase-like enolase superfamily enzyme